MATRAPPSSGPPPSTPVLVRHVRRPDKRRRRQTRLPWHVDSPAPPSPHPHQHPQPANGVHYVHPRAGEMKHDRPVARRRTREKSVGGVGLHRVGSGWWRHWPHHQRLLLSTSTTATPSTPPHSVAYVRRAAPTQPRDLEHTQAGRPTRERACTYTHTQTTQTEAHTRHSIGCQAIQGIHSSVALSIDYGASMFTVVHECVTYIRASDHRAGNMCDMRGNMGDAMGGYGV